MAHDHHHGDPGAFFREQLVTIGVCGAFALVTLSLCFSVAAPFEIRFGGVLNNMLAPKFHIWVLLGGATLLAMVVINAVAVWFSAGEAKAVPVDGHGHDHDHDHGHCDHDHGHENSHGHGHDHHHAPTAPPHDHDHAHDGHDHGWAPWRYAVLLLPVAIYFVVPLDALNSSSAAAIEVETPTKAVADKGEDLGVTFVQLQMAAMYPENRQFYEGKTVRLTGRYVGDGDSRFTLMRYKINCCAADAIPLDAVIMLDPDAKSKEKLDVDKLRNQWVQVTGRVQFVQRKDRPGEYATALILSPTEERPLGELVKIVPPDPNPYAS